MKFGTPIFCFLLSILNTTYSLEKSPLLLEKKTVKRFVGSKKFNALINFIKGMNEQNRKHLSSVALYYLINNNEEEELGIARILVEILEANANIIEKVSNKNLLEIALEKKKLEILKYLLEKDARISEDFGREVNQSLLDHILHHQRMSEDRNHTYEKEAILLKQFSLYREILHLLGNKCNDIQN